MDNSEEIIDILEQIKDDSGIPKLAKEKIIKCVQLLKDKTIDEQIKKDKIIQELTEILESYDLQSFTRSEILSIVGVLEE